MTLEKHKTGGFAIYRRYLSWKENLYQGRCTNMYLCTKSDRICPLPLMMLPLEHSEFVDNQLHNCSMLHHLWYQYLVVSLILLFMYAALILWFRIQMPIRDLLYESFEKSWNVKLNERIMNVLYATIQADTANFW